MLETAYLTLQAKQNPSGWRGFGLSRKLNLSRNIRDRGG